MLAGVDAATVGRVAVTSSTPTHVQSHTRCDTRIAVIRAARQLYRHLGAILMVGGEKFGLLRFDLQGKYLGYRTNTTCAAGTGSFLDQQAKRLQFSDMKELAPGLPGTRGRR